MEDNTKSPFSIYEEKFCNRCDNYNSCLGLISSTSTLIGIEDEKKIDTNNIGNKMFLDISKQMGVSLYTQKFKMMLECLQARRLMKEIDILD